MDERGIFHPRTCFVAGTLVTKLKVQYYDIARNGALTPDARYEEKVAIETVKTGDFVLSFDENTKAKSYKKVTELFINEVEYLFKLKLSSGEEIVTTWNHPFLKTVNSQKRNTSTLAVSLFGAMERKSSYKTLNGWKQKICERETI